MTPAEFRAWRAALGLSQRGAAASLGISARMVKLYERGFDHSRKVRGKPKPIVIPRAIELACYFLLKQADRRPFPPIGDELARRR